MADKGRSLKLADQSPLIQLIVSLSVIVVLGTAVFLLLVLLGSVCFNTRPDIILSMASAENGTGDADILRFLHVSQQISMFLVPSLIVARFLKIGDEVFLRTGNAPELFTLLLVIVLAALIIPVTSFTGELNSRMILPGGLSSLEEWMKVKEKEATDLTSLLIASEGFRGLALNLAAMALVPALCEEALFRGILQQLFCRSLRSAHAGIWITAIIFSTIHFQFYGFLPRLILGLIFGYIFFWTGNLWNAIAAHFTNNATLLLISCFTELSPAGDEAVNGELSISDFPFIPVAASTVIIFYLWNKFRGGKAGIT